MLKKIIIIIVVTVIASALAVGDFFFMRELPRPSAIIIHNILASFVGVGFIVAAEMVRRNIRNKFLGGESLFTRHSLNEGGDREKGLSSEKFKINYYSIFLLAIGLGMLAIHLIKIFFTRC